MGSLDRIEELNRANVKEAAIVYVLADTNSATGTSQAEQQTDARAVQTAARGFLARRVFLMLTLGTHANARSRRVQTHPGLVALQAAARRRAAKARYEGSLLPQAIRRVVVEPAALLLTRVARAALAKAEIAQRRRQWEAATEVQRFARGKSARLWRGVVKRVMVSAPLRQTF